MSEEIFKKIKNDEQFDESELKNKLSTLMGTEKDELIMDMMNDMIENKDSVPVSDLGDF